MSETLDHLIKKGSYFYRPNKAGYTGFKFDAGRYTKADAEAEASVEPWHMKALHQDSVPDDTAPDRHISKLIAALAAKDAEIERYRKALSEILGYDRNFYDNGRPGYEAIARAALADDTEGRS